MNEFTLTDCRQFLDALELLSCQKEFRGTFRYAIKGTVTLQTIDSLMDKRLKAYNFAYTELFKRYGILHDELYSRLDKLWEESLVEVVLPKLFRTNVLGGAGLSAAGASAVARGTSPTFKFAFSAATKGGRPLVGILGPIFTIVTVAISASQLAIMQYRLYSTWRKYKTKTYAFAAEYAKSKLESE